MCPGKAPAGSPVATSQSRTVPSRLPEASSVPAGLKTARASPVQYAGGCREDLAGFAGGQIPEGNRVAARHGGELVPVGVPGHGTDDMGLRHDVRRAATRRSGDRWSASQSRTVPSQAAEATRVPSGLKATS